MVVKKGINNANESSSKITKSKLQTMTKKLNPRYLNVYPIISLNPFISRTKIHFVLRCKRNHFNNSYFCVMSSIRQSRIEEVIKEELSMYFQRNAREICLGAMVTVTVVRITSDLSLARVYLSVFAGPDKKEVLQNVQVNASKIRGEVGRRLKNMKKIPELSFHIDDSLDYANTIDELLKKK